VHRSASNGFEETGNRNQESVVTKTIERSFLVGLIGSGIGGSLSPAMHEEEARHLGLKYVYRRIDLEVLRRGPSALSELLSAAESMGFDGVNVTYPCKQAVIELLDELSADAQALGAVNTVQFKEGRRVGHNTDWSGFRRAFERGLPGASMERVVQLGAGGAGAAVAHAAMTMGARELALVDVDPTRARTLAAELQARFPDARVSAIDGAPAMLGDALAAADGLIHATPTGMAKHPGMPLQRELLHPRLWVADVVYFPIKTELLKAAEALGCRTLTGGGMAVYQAVEAFEIFTGIAPNAERMFEHFQTLLS